MRGNIAQLMQQAQQMQENVQKAQEQVLELRSAATAFTSDYHLAEARVRFVTGAYPGLNFSQADK